MGPLGEPFREYVRQPLERCRLSTMWVRAQGLALGIRVGIADCQLLRGKREAVVLPSPSGKLGTARGREDGATL